MKILIINGTDLNKQASGSGVVLKQFLSDIPSKHEITLLNLGGKVDIPGIRCVSIEPKAISWLAKKLIPIFTFTSLMYSRFFKDRDVVRKINELHNKQTFDLVYYHDTIAMQNYEYLPGTKQHAHLIDLHSSSYTYYISSTNNLLKKLYYYREFKACLADEKEMIKQYEKLYLVNESEANTANNIHGTNKFVGINLGVDLESTLYSGQEDMDVVNFVYLGNLGYKANLDGLMNFINSYFEKLKEVKKYKLHIIGPGSEQFGLEQENIFGYGFVDDLSVFMSDMHFGVATMVNGSGLKNKIFDYLKFGLPVIVNSYTVRHNLVESPYLHVADDDDMLTNVVSQHMSVNKQDVKDSISQYDQKIVCQKFWSEINKVSK